MTYSKEYRKAYKEALKRIRTTKVSKEVEEDFRTMKTEQGKARSKRWN